MSTEPAVAGVDAEFLARLVDALPAGAFVLDDAGVVTFATREAAALVERSPDELVGMSVLSLVDHDTAWAYAAALAMVADFPDDITGPLRVTVVTASGEHRVADLWAMNRLDDPVLRGIVCLLTRATAAVGLGEAVQALAGDVPFATVAVKVARAMQGHPTDSLAALLAAGPSGFRLVTDEAADRLPPMTGPGPWADAVATGTRMFVESLDELAPEVAEAAAAAGYRTVWAEPVGLGGPPARGVLVLWRKHPGRPTPNELNVMYQGAAILGLAWDAHDRAE